MEFLEKDLEQIVFEADKDLLAKRGLKIEGKLFRQLRIGNYGVADLVTVKRPKYNPILNDHFPMEISIYELKKEGIGISTFLQAIRYARGIQRFIHCKKDYNISLKFKIVCIGKRIDLDSSYVFMSEFLTDEEGYTLELKNYTYSYKVDGIKFKLINGMKLTEEGF